MRNRLFVLGLLIPALLIPALISGRSAQAVQAGQVRIAELKGFVYGDGGYLQPLTIASPGYASTFDANGMGIFGWEFNNTTGSTLQNLRFVVFLDADIDQGNNTFFNEYGGLAGLRLPPGAPAGAIAASSWEIDEPGFLFGDLVQHLATGALDNTNSVPAGSGDDMALALGFQMGALAPGASATFAFTISPTDIGGLNQTDPDSNTRFYFNGYGASSGTSGTSGCITTCFRSPQFYQLHLNALVARTHLGGARVVIGGMNLNQPILVGININLVKLTLRGGSPGSLIPRTPLARLNQEFVAAQLSLSLTGGQGSPAVFSVLIGRLRCYRGLATFDPVKLSNGFTFTPESMLGDLVQQALFAIREDRRADMDALAILFDRLNGNDPLGRCN